jgi:hypothetical protein
MSNPLEFMRKISSSPSLIWKGGAGVLFLVMALAFIVYPDLIDDLSDNSRYAFSGLLAFYGAFRLITFYNEFKRKEDE